MYYLLRSSLEIYLDKCEAEGEPIVLETDRQREELDRFTQFLGQSIHDSSVDALRLNENTKPTLDEMTKARAAIDSFNDRYDLPDMVVRCACLVYWKFCEKQTGAVTEQLEAGVIAAAIYWSMRRLQLKSLWKGAREALLATPSYVILELIFLETLLVRCESGFVDWFVYEAYCGRFFAPDLIIDKLGKVRHIEPHIVDTARDIYVSMRDRRLRTDAKPLEVAIAAVFSAYGLHETPKTIKSLLGTLDASEGAIGHVYMLVQQHRTRVCPRRQTSPYIQNRI